MIEHFAILLFALAFAGAKALRDGEINENKQWHVWDTLTVFAGGFIWASCGYVHGFFEWWMPLIVWFFAQPFFEFGICRVRNLESKEKGGPGFPQERTIHLNELWSKLPLLRFNGFKMWLWDSFRIVLAIVFYFKLG